MFCSQKNDAVCGGRVAAAICEGGVFQAIGANAIEDGFEAIAERRDAHGAAPDNRAVVVEHGAWAPAPRVGGLEEGELVAGGSPRGGLKMKMCHGDSFLKWHRKRIRPML